MQKRLYRSRQERMFAGVCGGIAEYLDVDPTLVRLVFVALTFMGGPGPIIYVVLLLVVPPKPEPEWKRKRSGLDDVESDPMYDTDIPVPSDIPNDIHGVPSEPPEGSLPDDDNTTSEETES